MRCLSLDTASTCPTHCLFFIAISDFFLFAFWNSSGPMFLGANLRTRSKFYFPSFLAVTKIEA